MTKHHRQSLLLVANWDSDVGYAWWLMESFWAMLAQHYAVANNIILAYPSISRIPDTIRAASLITCKQSFGEPGSRNLLRECQFLWTHRVRAIYFSDRPSVSWRYLLYRLCGVRFIIVHDHTPGVRTQPTGFKRMLKWVLQRTPLVTADGLIGASAYVCQRFVDVNCAPRERCFAAPNGLPARYVEYSGPELRKEFHIAENIPIAVMTGRANHYKNIGFVLECLAQLRSEGRNLHFLFCGDGPDLIDFKRMTRTLGIDDRVTFAGRRDDIPQLLPQCNFAIHPSKGEVGYSLSILEYMQAGLPVIVPDNPSVCEATADQETGIIYREGDLDSLAAAATMLIDNTEKAARMGENAKRAVVEKFNLDNTHTALLAAFGQIDKAGILGKSTVK